MCIRDSHDAGAQHALAPRVVAGAQCVLQGVPQSEYFGRITGHQAARIRGFESAAGLAQQRLADARFELLDLAAQGLRRQVQLFACAHQATGTQHGVEITKMLVVCLLYTSRCV